MCGSSGHVRNLVETGSVPASELRHFLHSKSFYTKIILVTRKFWRIKAYAAFQNETHCMDLVDIDTIANGNNGTV